MKKSSPHRPSPYSVALRLSAAACSLLIIISAVAARSRFIAFAEDTTGTITSTLTDSPTSTDTVDTANTGDTSSTDISSDANATTTPDAASSSDLTDATGTLDDNGDGANQINNATTTNQDATGTASISTGGATSVVNLTNVVNANVVDSQGFEALLNLFGPYLGNVDLSGIQFTPSGDCTGCQASSLGVTNNNGADIENNVTASANTGSNSVDGATNANVTTGDATAVANVVNVANTNIVGSNYLLVVLNNFNQLLGNIIFPGQSFFSDLMGAPGSTSLVADSNLNVTNNNFVSVSNNTVVNADSGNNTSTSGDSSVTTGDATAVANTVTTANTNITGNSQVFLLVRVFGTWNGKIFNTPPGLAWQETPDGLLLTGSGASEIAGGCGCNGSTTIENDNNATVNNNVKVYALTGQNEISNTAGTGTIKTGRATAVANVVNLVNTNVIGHNLLLGIINIFGDWQGNLAFGEPDLWVGAQAVTEENPAKPGSEITYHLTIVNRGTADASNIALQAADSVSGITNILDPDGGTVSGGGITWAIPHLSAGASTTITYVAKVNGGTLPDHFTETINATENEDDANPADNADSLTFALDTSYNPGYSDIHISHLFIHDTNNASSTLPPGSKVHYKLLLGDGIPNGPAHDVAVDETLYDPFGNPVSSSTWDIGTIQPGQKFLVQYDTKFSTSTPSGWYISYASLEGDDSGGNIWDTADIISSSSVYIVNPNDYAATTPPPPQIIYVPAPSSTLATPHKTIVGKHVEDPKIELVPTPVSLIVGPSCPFNTAPHPSSSIPIAHRTPTAPRNAMASIGTIFQSQNATSLQGFISSTALVLAYPFKFWQ